MHLNNPNQQSRKSLLNQLYDRWMTSRVAPEETGRRLNLLSLNGVILTYAIGYAFFSAIADWNEDIWVRLYYVWQKTVTMWGFALIYQIIPNQQRRIVKPVLMLSILRLAWELLALIGGEDINSSQIVNFMFWAAVAVIIFWQFVRVLDWWRPR